MAFNNTDSEVRAVGIGWNGHDITVDTSDAVGGAAVAIETAPVIPGRQDRAAFHEFINGNLVVHDRQLFAFGDFSLRDDVEIGGDVAVRVAAVIDVARSGLRNNPAVL